MKKVLIFTYYWPPSGGAGVQRWLKFSKYLRDYDWQPIVITVDPAYATYPLLDRSLENERPEDVVVLRTKSREWFSVYKKSTGEESVPFGGFANEKQSVSIKEKIARFVRGNFFLPDPRKGWNRFAIEKAREVIRSEKIHCIITTSPPHSTQLIGLRLSREFNIPWIADLRDPWTDIYYYRKFYPTPLAHRINLSQERQALTGADHIITVSKGFKELFLSKKYLSEKKITVIPNGFDPEDFEKFKTDYPKEKNFIITYVGTLADTYPIQGLALACAELVIQHPDIKIRFIGSVSEKSAAHFKNIPNENLEFLPYMQHQVAVKYMQTSGALLLIIPQHITGKGILPGKIFEYMAAGSPILGIGPVDSESARMLEETGTGKMCAFGDETGIKNALQAFYRQFKSPSHSGSVSDIQKFSKKALAGTICKKMDEISGTD